MDAEIETWWLLQQLLTRYANACDDRDWARYRKLFTPDARIDYTEAYGRAGSVDEIVPWLEQIMDPRLLPSSQHLLANLVFERAGDTASGRAQYFNPDVFVENGRKVGLINGGVYRFDARRDTDGWRLSRLHAKLLWSTRAELTEFATAE
jgi:hypothetical protein